jgi:hypothetical protein
MASLKKEDDMKSIKWLVLSSLLLSNVVFSEVEKMTGGVPSQLKSNLSKQVR